MVPRAVLMKSSLVSVNTARQVNDAHSKTTVNAARLKSHFSKPSYSNVKRPIHKNTTFKNSNFNQRVNTIKDKNVNTVRPKVVVNVARPKVVLNAVKGNQVNVVNALACWVWKPKTKVIDHVSKHNSASTILKGFDYIDAQGRSNGCSRHIIGNMSYLTNFEEIDGGYVAFRGNPKGGKITGKVPRKNNMYSVDLKNVVPKGGLTFLFLKAISDESKLWHRRLGHINFKTMNKLGKQHRASCKSKTVSSIGQPLHMLHMDLFGPTFVKNLMKKMYCLVVTDDYSRFSLVFFLAIKDETSGILKSFITRVENLIDQKVKVIRCDNGTEFKNKEMNQFCERKGIKKEFSVARTPQQNGVAERKNRTLIEAARTMLADSKLPNTFWAEVVNTACYVQNTVLLTKPYNKTHYELFLGRNPLLGFMRPFGYSINSKAFRVFNSGTRIVEENMHVQFSETTPNIRRSGPNWLFDIDALIKSRNYKPVVVGNQSNGNAGTKVCDDAGKTRMETVPGKDYILLPLLTADPPFSQSSKSSPNDGSKPSSDDGKKVDENPSEVDDQEKADDVNNTNNVNVVSTNKVNTVGVKTSIKLPDDPNMPHLEDIIYSDDDEDVGAEADMNNLDVFMPVSPILTTREEPKKVIHALKDPSWIKAMQEELLQFKLQEVWTLVDLPNEKRAIGTKWVFRNKKDERGIVIKNKAILVAQGYTQEEGINYDEVFAPVGRIEAIRLFLAYSSFKYFVVYQMDVKSAFLYGKIEEEVYKEDGIFISQDKYVSEILKKFGFTDVKTVSTPMETQKPLLKDEDGEEVDVHLYRSMIGSLMYLTSSRTDIMFAVCAHARYQVNPKVSHLYAMKRIFRYLKGQPKSGLWYPKDSPFDFVAYTDSDYAGASLNRKSTT
ncbi:putative ribonuclease H-like domain-containing protein [Tanacetum coccineum]